MQLDSIMNAITYEPYRQISSKNVSFKPFRTVSHDLGHCLFISIIFLKNMLREEFENETFFK